MPQADPAVRSALEAAHRNASSFYSMTETADILAAFLRALPARFPLPRDGGQTWGHAHGEMARLALAVEQAARDAA